MLSERKSYDYRNASARPDQTVLADFEIHPKSLRIEYTPTVAGPMPKVGISKHKSIR